MLGNQCASRAHTPRRCPSHPPGRRGDDKDDSGARSRAGGRCGQSGRGRHRWTRPGSHLLRGPADDVTWEPGQPGHKGLGACWTADLCILRSMTGSLPCPMHRGDDAWSHITARRKRLRCQAGPGRGGAGAAAANHPLCSQAVLVRVRRDATCVIAAGRAFVAAPRGSGLATVGPFEPVKFRRWTTAPWGPVWRWIPATILCARRVVRPARGMAPTWWVRRPATM